MGSERVKLPDAGFEPEDAARPKGATVLRCSHSGLNRPGAHPLGDTTDFANSRSQSRSEFIRYTLRDAVEFPTFDRDELVALLEAEEDIREGRTTSAEEARERFGTSDE